MKLRDYFEEQKNTKTGSNQKIFIYDYFLNKNEKKPLLQRFSFYSKVTTYSFVFILTIFSFYISFIDYEKSKKTPSKIVDSGSGFFIKEDKNDQNIAKANSIGNVVEAKGEFKILKDGKEYDTNKLYDGNTIILMNDSKLKFQVNSGVRAYIKGPAELKINYLGEDDGVKNFLLNHVSGKYIEINSQEEEKKKNKENIILKTNDFEVEPKNVDSNMDLKVTSKDNNEEDKVLENNGGDVVVKRMVDDEKVYSEVKSQQTVKIKEKIKNIQEVKKITEKVKNNDIEDEYAVESGSENIDKNNSGSVLSGVSTKDVLTEKKFSKLEDHLYDSFVKNDIDSLVTTYFKGDKDAIKIVYKNFLTRILKVYEVLELEIDSKIMEAKRGDNDISLNDIYISLDQLIAKSTKKYYIPDQYTKTLKKMLAWTLILKDNEFGKFQGENLSSSEILDRLELDKYKKDLLIK